MKKRVMCFAVFFVSLVFSIGLAAAEPCDLDLSLLNQDPYPAVPGEYVEVVLQVTGINNPECKKVNIELVEDFPFSLDPSVPNPVELFGGTYIRNFETYLLVPYKIRVDKEAIDGNNALDVTLSYEQSGLRKTVKTEQFNINVEDVDTNFEIYVKNYESATNALTFEVINVGDSDVEALTIEVPKQENIVVKGSNYDIVGGLDSGEDSTFSFEAVPKDGEIELILHYNDEINERRSVNKKVMYVSEYFNNRKADESGQKSLSYYLLILLIFGIVVWAIWKWRKKKKLERYHNSKKK